MVYQTCLGHIWIPQEEALCTNWTEVATHAHHIQVRERHDTSVSVNDLTIWSINTAQKLTDRTVKLNARHL